MKQVLAGSGVCTVLLLVVGAVWWVRTNNNASDAAEAYTHMHCPDCALQVKYQLALENRPCPQCGPAGARMIPTVGPQGTGSDAAAGRMSTSGQALAVVTVALVLVQAGAYGWLLYARACRIAAEAARKRPMVCRCPFCSRKIGYAQTKIGAGTLCPRCKTAFTLPADGLVSEECDPHPRGC